MNAAWVTIAGLTLGTIVIKAVGPVSSGGRVLWPRAAAVIGLLAPALLAALVATLTLGAERTGVTVDARLVGLGAAAAALAARLPLLAVVGSAAVAAALARALS